MFLIMDFAPNKRGSMELFLLGLARELTRRGNEMCCLFSGPWPEWFGAEAAKIMTLFRTNGSPLALGNFSQTMQTVFRLRPMTVSFWFVSMFSWRTLLLTMLPFVSRSIFCDRTSAAGSEKRGLVRLVAKWRGRLASACYDRIVSVSEHNRRRNIERNFIRREKTQVIYNGVMAMAGGDPDDDPSLQEHPYLLFCGQLIREKGVYTLLQAFWVVVRDSPGSGVRLVLAGEGREKDELVRLARDLGIEARVSFLGLRDDVPKLMSSAAATVVPSEWPEAFGFVAVEAMAAGCPVIVSDAGALPEIVGDTGLIFHAADLEGLVSLIRDVLRPQYRREQSALLAKARARVASKFARDRMVREYADLLSTREPNMECAPG